MKPEITGKVKGIFSRKAFRVTVICIILLLAAAFLFVKYLENRSLSAANSVKQQTARVMRGDLSVTVTGSGSIVSSNRTDIIPNVNGSVTRVLFKEGDRVKAGDLLYEIDDSDARLNIEKINNSILQTQLTQDSNINSINGLIVTAPFNGQVSGISINEGDVLGKNSPVLTITDQSKLKLTVPFNGTGVREFIPGGKAVVFLQGMMQTVNGKISSVNNEGSSTSTGGIVYYVEVMIDNPGPLKEGMKASVEIPASKGTYTSTDTGTLEYVDSMALKCSSGGTVKKIDVKENQHVKKGDVLLELQSDDLDLSKKTTDLKLQDFQAQLDSAQKQLQYYNIKAPFDGIIVKQSVNPGDSAKQGQLLSTIADYQNMEFSIPIDELDIAKVDVGQKVDVTVDALTETSSKPLSGQVSKIAMEGTSTNGVTTYQVTIKINEIDKLKVGMNANAEVYIDRKTDVLYLPIEAVQKVRNMSYVMVKAGTEDMAALKNGQGSAFNPYANRAGQGANQGNSSGNSANNSSGDSASSNGAGRNGAGNRWRSGTDTGTDSSGNTGSKAGNSSTGNGNGGTGGNNTGSKTGNNSSTGNGSNGTGSNNTGSKAGNGNTDNSSSGNTGSKAGNGNTDSSNGGAGSNSGTNSANSGKNTGSSSSMQSGNSGIASMLSGRNRSNNGYYKNAIPKMVEVGINNDMYIEIISGLNEGDEVILPQLASTQGNTGTSAGQNNSGMNRIPFMDGGGGGR